MSSIQRDTDRFCLRCGYPLQGLAEDRCPECGRAFDPADPRSYSNRPPLHPVKAMLLRPVGWPTLLTAGGASSVWLAMYDHPVAPNPPLMLAIMVWFGVGAWWVVRLLAALAIWVSDRHRRYAPARRVWRWLVPPVLLALTVAGQTWDVKFRIRFVLSKPALERLVQQAAQLPPGGTLPDQTVGLFQATDIRAHGSEYLLFSFTGANDEFTRGFAYSASGTRPQLWYRPFNSPFNTGESGCQHFSGNWYVWWQPNW